MTYGLLLIRNLTGCAKLVMAVGTVAYISSPPWPGTRQEPCLTGRVTSYHHHCTFTTRFCSAWGSHVRTADHCNKQCPLPGCH